MTRLLTTAEVARRLDVQPATVYAYVSRGLLTNVGGRRASRFAQDEVERLVRRGREGRRPSGAIERINTGITLLTDDGPAYRGRPVGELLGSSAEAVAHLLWTGSLGPGEPFRASAGLVDVAAGAAGALPPSARLVDRLRVAVAAASAVDPLRHDLDPAAVVRRAETILALAVDALARTAPRPGPAALDPAAAAPLDGVGRPGGSLAARLWPALAGRRATPEQERLLNAVLILLADHDLAVSTLAARVAASARANPYAVVSAGLGALDGPRHGAASTLAHRFLAEALTDPVAALAERLRTGSPIPGFGHRVYRTRDPRTALVLDLLGDGPVRAAVDAVAAPLAGRPDGFPNVDLALAAVVHAHDLRPDAGEAIFAVARTVGWIAHAVEEYAEPGLRFRAEGVYTGPVPDGRPNATLP
ncbi:MAG TPA: citrate/2-methylcitrate synthase [Pseudonocardia sp.]|nr:citrate/2-methylcitrate synthase [Pseudonocardia sp.]